MGKTFLYSFAVIGGVIAWIGYAADLIASSVVSPASEHQCLEYAHWCFVSQHPQLGWVGVLMMIGALAAFATVLIREIGG